MNLDKILDALPHLVREQVSEAPLEAASITEPKEITGRLAAALYRGGRLVMVPLLNAARTRVVELLTQSALRNS